MKSEDTLREECAVFGVSAREGDAAGMVLNGLLSLQHRGQEGAGIAVLREEGGLQCRKDVGLVGEVFTPAVMETLAGARVAVGHTRYSTTGASIRENTGPFVAEYLTGRIAVAHNGNITNADALRSRLRAEGLYFAASSDSEAAAQLIALCALREGDLTAGIRQAAARLEGAYSLVIAGEGKLFAVRDPNGYRPLCIGRGTAGIAAASESCALEIGGFHDIEDVKPGELLVMENGRLLARDRLPASPSPEGGLCLFEYVYFARPDSVIDGLSVYEARHAMGRILAREQPAEADVVCGVPDSGLEAAAGYSAESGLPLAAGFMKNRYIGRSFIFPTQTQRENAVRLKLNPLSAAVRGKRVVLVDDSIVRGTTSEQIVRSLRAAGAAEVHVRISSPPFRRTCHYGTDIGREETLIANRMPEKAIGPSIGADSLGYISLQGLRQACAGCTTRFCTVCFGE